MELKEALREAVRYVSEMESLTGDGETSESFLANGCVAIEEVRYNELENARHVSVGFFRPWNRRGVYNPLQFNAQSVKLRTVKTVVMDAETGEAIDYRSFELVPM